MAGDAHRARGIPDPLHGRVRTEPHAAGQGRDVAAHFGYWTEVVWVCFKAIVVVTMSGVAAIGFWLTRTTLVERVLAGVAAAFIMGSFPWSDEIGLAVAAAITAVNWSRSRKTGLAASGA